jgi:hypothetical protein
MVGVRSDVDSPFTASEKQNGVLGLIAYIMPPRREPRDEQPLMIGLGGMTNSEQTDFIGRRYNDYDGRWWSGIIAGFPISNTARTAA